MKNFFEKLRNQPHAVKRKIFVVAMICCFFAVFAAYVLSLSRTVAYAIEEKRQMGGIGEFHLPELQDGIGATLKDVFGKQSNQ